MSLFSETAVMTILGYVILIAIAMKVSGVVNAMFEGYRSAKDDASFDQAMHDMAELIRSTQESSTQAMSKVQQP